MVKGGKKMEKTEVESIRGETCDLDDNLEDLILSMDLDFSWTGILKSLLKMIFSKKVNFPQPIRKKVKLVDHGQ